MRKAIILIAFIFIASAFKLAETVSDPQQCIEEKCPKEWDTCTKDAKCMSTLDDCHKKCDTKASCWTLCLSSHGNQNAITVMKCAQANGCDKAKVKTALVIFTPAECIQQHCSAESTACRNDRGCFAALQDCEKKCTNNQTCFTTCLAGKGNAPASAFWKCIVDNDCMNKVEATKPETALALVTPQECIQQHCST